MAGDLRPRHREAHVGEEPARPPLARCAARSPRTARRGAAPTASIPSSSATGSSSAVVTAELCPLRLVARMRAQPARVAGDLPLRDRERDERIAARPASVGCVERLRRFERVPLGLQPVVVEVLGRRGGRSARRPATGRRASTSSRQTASACATKLARRREAPVVPAAACRSRRAASTARATARRRFRTRSATYTIAPREGDRHPRGRRARGAPLRGRRPIRSPAPGEVLVRMRVGVAEPPRRLDAQGAPVGAEAADPRRGRRRRGRGARRRRRGPRAGRAGRDQPRARARRGDPRDRRAHAGRRTPSWRRSRRRTSTRCATASRSRRRPRSRSSSRPRTGCSSRARGCRRASGC